MSDKYPVRYPTNTMHGVIQEFLEGVPFSESLCNRVSSTYCTDISEVSYKRRLEFVKSIFTQSKHGCILPDVYAVNTSFEFDALETALVIRLINLSYHGELIVVLNGAIVYIPKSLRNHTEEEIRIHTHRRIQSVKPNKLTTWLNRRFASKPVLVSSETHLSAT